MLEIVPLLAMKRIPGAAAAVAGVIDYRGRPVPVIDLSELALMSAARRCMSTLVVYLSEWKERGRRSSG